MNTHYEITNRHHAEDGGDPFNAIGWIVLVVIIIMMLFANCRKKPSDTISVSQWKKNRVFVDSVTKN